MVALEVTRNQRYREYHHLVLGENRVLRSPSAPCLDTSAIRSPGLIYETRTFSPKWQLERDTQGYHTACLRDVKQGGCLVSRMKNTGMLAVFLRGSHWPRTE